MSQLSRRLVLAFALTPVFASCAPRPSEQIDPGQLYLPMTLEPDPGAPVVEYLFDFQCPHCRDAEAVNHTLLHDLSSSGQIDLRMMPRPMLDRDGITVSRDAAAVYTALHAIDPELTWDASRTLYDMCARDDRPSTDEFARAVFQFGGGDRARDAVATGAYTDWLESVEEECAERGVGTPTAYINGVQTDRSPAIPGALAGDIAQALADA